MSHELSNNNGRIEMAYAGAEKPWHGLGVQVPWYMTTEEALTAANLDWRVEKMPLLSSYDLTPVEDHFLTVRSDNQAHLGVVGSRYQPVSNREAFQFFDLALGEGQGQVDTAGALGNGERVWMMAKMPEVADVLPGDPMERYLLVSTSHDGSSSVQVTFTNIRVVCQNTLTAALRRCSHSVKLRHTRNVEAKMKEAQAALQCSTTYWQEMKSACQHLALTSVQRVEVGVFLDAMFPTRKEDATPKGREVVTELIEDGRGTDIPGVRGSAWGLYNAYTEYLDHERSTRGGKSNWETSTFGSGVGDRQRAFDTLLKMTS
jgi:phage/plasmid-like protein (TIGR03299 family)